MNEENVDICQICLRTDLKLKVINTKLSDFHDEFCDFSMGCILDPKYCTICEHLLQKVCNFRAKCIMANEILNGRKKRKPLKELYTLLPPSNLGTWIDSNIRIYQFNYGEQPPLSDINGVINTTPKEKPNPTDILVPTHSSLNSLIDDPLSNVTNDNTVLVLKDPLVLENEIKTENNEETYTELVKDDKTDKLVENVQDVKIENVHPKEDEQLIIDNLLEKDKRDLSYDIGNLNEPVFVNETDQSSEIVDFSDDADINSNDDCDSDDFISNYDVYCKKQKMKQMKQTSKKTVKSNNVETEDQNLLYSSKSEELKRSLLELANISLSDDDIEDKKKKIAPKRSIARKQYTVKRKSLAKKDEEMQPVKEFNEHISRAPGNHFYKEKLINLLVMKFNECGDLKTEDGTVLDKKKILVSIEQENNTKEIRELLVDVKAQPFLLTEEILKQLMTIQTANDDYLKVFDMLYLNTEEKMLEEFEKRKTYKAYLEATYKCDHCHQWFTHKKFLEYHMKWHDAKMGDHVCPVCKTRKKSKTRLSKHVIIHKSVYKCKLCHVITNYKHAMINHFQMHSGVRYTCKFCNGVYGTNSSYRNHLTKRCKGTRYHLTCTLCAVKFYSAAGLKLHKRVKHEGEPPVEENPNATCSVCSLTFASVEVYHKHLKISHDVPFDTHPHIPRPKRKCPVNYKKPECPIYTCRVCDKKSRGYGWLTSHFKTEHPNVNMSVLYLDKAKHLCDICGNSYASKFGLSEHMRKHNSERPFGCDKCPKRFINKYHRNNHSKTHEPPEFECKWCGKMFNSSANLFSHNRTHIGDRKFKCFTCSKGFLSSTGLNEHVRGVHDNVKRVKKLVTRNNCLKQ